MDSLLRRLLRSALRRGMSDRNWAWFVIAASAYVLRRTLADRGGVISELTLTPGEQVLITVRDRNEPELPAEIDAR